MLSLLVLDGPWHAGAAPQSPFAVSEFAVKTGPQIQSGPRVSGRWVVWRDGSPSQDWRLTGRNLETGLEFVVNPGAAPAWPVDFGGDIVVSAEVSFDQASRTPLYGIFGYRLPEGQRFTIAAPKAPSGSSPLYRAYTSTDGRTVVWLENEGVRHDLYGYDLATQRPITISTSPGEKDWPAVSAGAVVWRDRRNTPAATTAADIYAYDVSMGLEWRMSDTTEDVSPPGRCERDGRVVCYTRRQHVPNGLRCLGTESALSCPAISPAGAHRSAA